MTDPFRPDDELLSAHLDGELTAEESDALAARLAAEPSLAERQGELRAASRLAATPVAPLSAEKVDDLVAAALEAGTAAPNVTDLGRVAAQRRLRVPRVAVAAAVIIGVALAIPALRAISDGDDTETAIEADMAGNETGAADAGTATDDAAEFESGEGSDADDGAAAEALPLDAGADAADGAPAPEAAAGFDEAADGTARGEVDLLPDSLGVHDDLAGLRAAVLAVLPTVGTVPDEATTEPLTEADVPADTDDADDTADTADAACQAAVDRAGRTLLFGPTDPADSFMPLLTIDLADAVVDDRLVLVAAVTGDAGRVAVVVVDPVDCGVLDDALLD